MFFPGSYRYMPENERAVRSDFDIHHIAVFQPGFRRALRIHMQMIFRDDQRLLRQDTGIAGEDHDIRRMGQIA